MKIVAVIGRGTLRGTLTITPEMLAAALADGAPASGETMIRQMVEHCGLGKEIEEEIANAARALSMIMGKINGLPAAATVIMLKPEAALTPIEQVLLFRALRNAEGRAIIITATNSPFIAPLAHRIAEFEGGKARITAIPRSFTLADLLLLCL